MRLQFKLGAAERLICSDCYITMECDDTVYTVIDEHAIFFLCEICYKRSLK